MVYFKSRREHMDYKKNFKYFENKKLLLYGSGALLAIGLLLWFGPFWGPDNHYVMYIFSVLSIVLGGVVFMISVGSTSTDKKIDEQIEEAFKLFDDETNEKFDLYERQLSYVTPAQFEGYKYYEGAMVRRDRSGRYRTDIYVKNRVCFTKETVVIACREISLIKEQINDRSVEIPYADIKTASAEDGSIRYGKATVKFVTVSIELNSGDTLQYQAQASQAIDQLVADVNHLAEKRR